MRYKPTEEDRTVSIPYFLKRGLQELSDGRDTAGRLSRRTMKGLAGALLRSLEKHDREKEIASYEREVLQLNIQLDKALVELAECCPQKKPKKQAGQ